MDEDVLNLQIRRFLKKVGITSQREIEKAVRGATQSGALGGDATIDVSMTLRIPELDVDLTIDDSISLE
jgi:hypothetical protein